MSLSRRTRNQTDIAGLLIRISVDTSGDKDSTIIIRPKFPNSSSDSHVAITSRQTPMGDIQLIILNLLISTANHPIPVPQNIPSHPSPLSFRFLLTPSTDISHTANGHSSHTAPYTRR